MEQENIPSKEMKYIDLELGDIIEIISPNNEEYGI